MSLLHHSSMLVWTGYWAGVTIEHPLAIIFAELLEILVLALEAQYEDAKLLGLQATLQIYCIATVAHHYIPMFATVAKQLGNIFGFVLQQLRHIVARQCSPVWTRLKRKETCMETSLG